MKRRNTLRFFILGTGLLPVLLLLMAVMETHIAARQMQDVNVSGSLRFRSLWLYGATHTVPTEDWRPMWMQMDSIRRRLRVTYPRAVTGTDASWNAASEQLNHTGRLDWTTANALRTAADTMTLAIAHRAQRDALGAGLMMTLGLVGMVALVGKSLMLARRTEQAEAESARLAAILEATPDFVGMADPQGRVLYHNHAFCTMAGLAPGALLRGLHIKDCHPPEAARRLHDEAFPVVRTQGVWTGESILRDKDGRDVPVSQTILAHRNAAGDIERFSTIARDITARRQAEENLRQAEEKYRLIYENATEGITQTTPQGRFLTANSAMARILGYQSPQQLIDEMTDIGGQLYADPADRARYAELLMQDGRAVAFEARLRRRDGSLIWASMNARAVRDAAGKVLYFEGTVEDVTAQREAAESLKDHSIVLQFQKAELEKANAELEMLATTDGLTGLCNHRTFQQKLVENFQSARRYGPPLSLLLLDVDCFKQYNDAFGHPAGDAVLHQVAALLRETTRTTDVPARYGGEEFAVILPHTDAAGAAIIAERIRAAVEDAHWPLRPITVSAGVCTLCAETNSPAALVASADTALYAAKHAGRNRIMADNVPAALSLQSAA